MSKSTISTFELFQMFPDAESARVYMEGKRWPDGAVCPACDEAKTMAMLPGTRWTASPPSCSPPTASGSPTRP